MLRRAPPSLLLDPALLSPSDLVVRLPPPDVQRYTHHFSEFRFFHQVQYVHDQVDDAIHITRSHYPERDGSLKFTNVYAMYEVEHWPNAAAHADYTDWVMDTIINVREGTALPPMTPKVRKIVKACVQEGMSGNYCWLYRLFPEVQKMTNHATMASRVARNSVGILIEGPATAKDLPMRRISYQFNQSVALANVVNGHMPGELGLLVDPKNTRMTIKDPVIRQLVYMAKRPRRRWSAYFGNHSAVMRGRESGELVPPREGQGFYSQEEWDSLSVVNRPWTSFAAQQPTEINVSDLDDQDLAELDALDAARDAQAAELSRVPRGGKRVIAPTITIVGPTGSTLVQKGGPRFIETSTVYVQADGLASEEQIGNSTRSTTPAKSAASSAPTVRGSRLVQQSGNSSTSTTSRKIILPLALTVSEPLSSQTVGDSSSSTTPAAPARPSTPTTTRRRVSQPSTPPQQSLAASPKTPGTDDTIQLLSSPESPIPAAQSAQARSPSKIPRNQKPPKTFGEVEAEAAAASTATAYPTRKRRQCVYNPGRTGKGRAARRAVPVVQSTTTTSAVANGPTSSWSRTDAPARQPQLQQPASVHAVRPLDLFPPRPRADGRLEVPVANPYTQHLQQRRPLLQAPGTAGFATQETRQWNHLAAPVQGVQQQQQGQVPFSIPHQQMQRSPFVPPVARVIREEERAALRDSRRDDAAVRAGLQSSVLDPRLFDDDDDGRKAE